MKEKLIRQVYFEVNFKNGVIVTLSYLGIFYFLSFSYRTFFGKIDFSCNLIYTIYLHKFIDNIHAVWFSIVKVPFKWILMS